MNSMDSFPVLNPGENEIITQEITKSLAIVSCSLRMNADNAVPLTLMTYGVVVGTFVFLI